MKRVLFTLSIGFVGAEHREVMEYDDDSTEKEIEVDWQQWAWGYIDGSYNPVDEDDDEY